ncbi:UvrD-helicase domain-containing protein [Silvanigrella aquatica]|nr:UvrD-helicase domain-containing protein [Silvanigrella aquatica]
MNHYTIEQQKCIQFFPHTHDVKQHLLIEAGAGAGKTAVLTERIKWLLINKPKNINPSKLFIVTFSNDATKQIQEKIEKEISKDLNISDALSLIHISTIDSFFAELVQCIYPTWWESKQKNTFQMPPRLQLIEEDIVCQELKNSIHHFFIQHHFNDIELAYTIDFILSGAIKKSFIDSQGTLETILKTLCNETFLASSPEHLRIAAKEIHPSTPYLIHEFHKLARNEYEKRIIKGEFTYSDRALFLKENLKNNIPIQLQELIVDEYQDTNHIQHEILFRMVTECKARMIVVGDPKQSIYGFRNASVDVFQNLKIQNNWEHIELKKNFRSQPNLLNEMNLLSHFAFSWENPNFSAEFKNSYFYSEAKKKFTPENALEAGIKIDITKEEPCVHLVTTSLNKERFFSDIDKEFISQNNIKLEQYSLAVYANYIKEYQKKYNTQWNEMVILCEENKDAEKISQALKNIHVPVLNGSQKNKDTESSLEYQVALSLSRCLAGENDLFDLYQIMQSPLSHMTHHDIEKYFYFKKCDQFLENKIINIIEEHKIIAKDNFFKAWQLLRWKLVNLHNDFIKKSNASLFCAKMDQFSFALSAKLDSPHFRETLENSIADKINDKINLKNKNILPYPLRQWNVKSSSHIDFENSNSLEIKTVHKAKGLQWKHVFFYPKYGKLKSMGKFVSSLSDSFLDITWLQDDVENMSVLKRIRNEKFTENDMNIEYKPNGEIKKSYYFPNLRKQAEQDFERQRVFYTAFTRAQENLILLQPKRLKKDGFRDEIGKITECESLDFQNYLEEEVFIKYLDLHFKLRGFPKTKGKSAKNSEKKLPPEPWLQQDQELSPKNILNENKKISYQEYGPYFIKKFLEKKAENSNSEDIKYESAFSFNFFKEKYFKLDNDFILEKSNHEQIEKDESISKNNKFQNINYKIDHFKKNRERISKGILYHAAAENRKATLNSLQYLIEKISIAAFHEFEVWIKTSNKNNFLNTSRHIVDFLGILNPKDLLNLPFNEIYNLSHKEIENIKNKIQHIPINTKILFIIDYKTGNHALSHIDQIKNYMKIFSSINGFPEVKLDDHENSQFIPLGCLCYNNKLQSSNILTLDGQNLPFYNLMNGESIYLFI